MAGLAQQLKPKPGQVRPGPERSDPSKRRQPPMRRAGGVGPAKTLLS